MFSESDQECERVRLLGNNVERGSLLFLPTRIVIYGERPHRTYNPVHLPTTLAKAVSILTRIQSIPQIEVPAICRDQLNWGVQLVCIDSPQGGPFPPIGIYENQD